MNNPNDPSVTPTLLESYFWGAGTDELLAEDRTVAVIAAGATPGSANSLDVRWALEDRVGSAKHVLWQRSPGARDLSLHQSPLNAFGVLDGSGSTLAADSSVSDVTTQPTVTHRYTGRPYDADLNLYDYRARWYEAQLGKFIQEDPIGLAAGDNNFYRYVGNNPLNLVDPSGLAATSNSTDHPRSIYDSIIDMSGLGTTGSSSSYNDDVWFGNLPSYSASQLAQPFQWSAESQASEFNRQAESIWYQDYDNTPHWITQGRNQAFTRAVYGSNQAPNDTYGGMFLNELGNTAAWVNNGINSFAESVATSVERNGVNSGSLLSAMEGGVYGYGIRTGGAIVGGLVSTAIDPVGTIGGSLASFDQNVQSIYNNARATGQSTSSALYQSLGYGISVPTGLNTSYESFTDQSTVTGQSYNRTLDQRASSFFFGVSQMAGTGAGVGAAGNTATRFISQASNNGIDLNWKAKIHGRAQKTGTDGHQFRSYREAIKAAKDPDVVSVHLDHGYNRGLGLDPKTIQPNRRPDVLVRYLDDKVMRIEVQSNTDVLAVLRNRNAALDKQLIDAGFMPTPPVVIKPTAKPTRN